MFILIATAVFEMLLLAAIIWSVRRKPVRVQVPARRRDDFPHAL
jgi:uncharacterized iron-regulated membrane protein